MNKFIFVTLALFCLALTPVEKRIVQHAKDQLSQAQQESVILKDELSQAQGEAALSALSAQSAESKAKTAQDQAVAEHAQLVKAVDQNAKMKKVYDACTKWWGLGAILYGIGSLLKHVLIGIAFIVVVMILLMIFVPAAAPILRAIGSVFGSIFSIIGSIFARFLAWIAGLFAKKSAPVPLPPAQNPPPPAAS